LTLPAFALTLFVSALLLFLLQPMAGKMITPLLGGTPAVWNTCMVLFQGLLLAGYAYAHASSSHLASRNQVVLHLLVLLVPLAFFPLAVDKAKVSGDREPVLTVLLLLATSVGVPFLVVSTGAPLLQKWFARTGHAAARDPYFLYAASNLGSMMALLGYPTVVEPWLTLEQQRWWWCTGYCVLVVLVAGCAALSWRAVPQPAEPAPPPGAKGGGSRKAKSTGKAPATGGGLTLRRRLWWVALAAVPSSLTLGATTYISFDLAAIPLFWVVPLALYLLSFIFVFARVQVLPHRLMAELLPPLLLVLLFFLLSGAQPLGVAGVVAVNLATLFVAAMVCHGELAGDRPSSEHLTEFFLWMSVGGVVGGIFNALVAPVVFNSVAEYYLALLAACFLLPRRPGRGGRSGVFGTDVAVPVAIGLITAGLSLAVSRPEVLSRFGGAAAGLGPGLAAARAAVQYGLPALLCWAFGWALAGRPLRFAAGTGALLLAAWLCQDAAEQHRRVLQRRGFFGVLGVDVHLLTASSGERRTLVQLWNGTAIHGRQFREPCDEARDRRLRSEPLAYYHCTGPLGRVLAAYNTSPARPLGVIGLGGGTLAAYALPGQKVDFYEIDPLVRDLALGPDSPFTFVADARSRGARPALRLGDARLVMEREPLAPADRYGILVVDAFSSDAIPVHLMTRESLRLYLERLRDDGVLCFHISNQYLHLRPVLANLAAAEGLTGKAWLDLDPRISTNDPRVMAKLASEWVVLARRPEQLERLGTPGTRRALAAAAGSVATLWSAPWEPLEPDPKVALWTDDYSNLLSVFKHF
jgi:hypothetical protein